MKLDPGTFGGTKAMIVLAEILTEIEDKKTRRQIKNMLSGLDKCIKDLNTMKSNRSLAFLSGILRDYYLLQVEKYYPEPIYDKQYRYIKSLLKNSIITKIKIYNNNK